MFLLSLILSQKNKQKDCSLDLVKVLKDFQRYFLLSFKSKSKYQKMSLDILENVLGFPRPCQGMSLDLRNICDILITVSGLNQDMSLDWCNILAIKANLHYCIDNLEQDNFSINSISTIFINCLQNERPLPPLQPALPTFGQAQQTISHWKQNFWWLNSRLCKARAFLE